MVHTMTYPAIEDQLVPIGDAARRLGVSVDTIRRWESEGKIAGTRTLGNQRRFARSEIERLLSPKEAA